MRVLFVVLATIKVQAQFGCRIKVLEFDTSVVDFSECCWLPVSLPLLLAKSGIYTLCEIMALLQKKFSGLSRGFVM